jgi:ammonia channel protein AmtB
MRFPGDDDLPRRLSLIDETGEPSIRMAHLAWVGSKAINGVSRPAVHWKSRSTLDDTLDVFPCHGVGGIVGMVLTGVLAREVGLFWGQTATFVAHMAALVIVSAYSFLGSMAIYKLTDLIIPLRVTEEEERVGLDLSQHGEFMELEPMRQFGYSE